MAMLSESRLAALLATRATVGIDTPQKIFAAVVSVIVSVILAHPTGLWGKVIVGAARFIVFLILFFWHRRDLSRQPVKFGLSPYSEQARHQLRAEQHAQDGEIARLRAVSAQLAAEMAKLDTTTTDGQLKFRELANQKKPIDQKLAELEKRPKTKLGHWNGDDRN
jgi:hypothetical protein